MPTDPAGWGGERKPLFQTAGPSQPVKQAKPVSLPDSYIQSTLGMPLTPVFVFFSYFFSI